MQAASAKLLPHAAVTLLRSLSAPPYLPCPPPNTTAAPTVRPTCVALHLLQLNVLHHRLHHLRGTEGRACREAAQRRIWGPSFSRGGKAFAALCRKPTTVQCANTTQQQIKPTQAYPANRVLLGFLSRGAGAALAGRARCGGGYLASQLLGINGHLESRVGAVQTCLWHSLVQQSGHGVGRHPTRRRLICRGHRS